MPINCICPKCRKPLSIDEKYAGQPMRCPMCSSMFQSPSLAAVAATPAANPFAQAPAYEGPAPPWQASAKDPHAPEWPWLVQPAVQAVMGPEDLSTLSPMERALRLAPGWHMVLRGLGLLPGSLIVIFTSLALTVLYVILFRPDDDSQKVLLLVIIPVVVISVLAVLTGIGLCCLVPGDSKLRPWAIGAAGTIFLGTVAGLLALFFRLLLNMPGWSLANPTLSSIVGAVQIMALVGGLLLLIGGAVVFQLFMRGIVRAFGNKRLAQHLLWYLIAFALWPAFAIFLALLFRGTAAVLGILFDPEWQGAAHVVHNVAQFSLAGIFLAGFLWMLRNVRIAILRAIAPNKV
jgi:hypothetical protein